MGFDHGLAWEGVFSFYLQLTNEAIRRHKEEPGVQLGVLAREIYEALVAKLPAG